MNPKAFFFLLFFLACSNSYAMPLSDRGGAACSSCHVLTLQEAKNLVAGIGAEVKDVKPAAVGGLWELLLEKDGQQAAAYVDYTKKYILPGPLFALASAVPAGPKQPAQKAPVADPKQIPLDNSLVLGNPAGKKKLFVFTDPDCPYCATFHEELKKLVAAEPDLAVYIKLFPLQMHPRAYAKSRAILAAKSLELLEKAYHRGEVPIPEGTEGKEAVDATLKLGASLGVNGTPTFVLPDGRIKVGGDTAEAIRKMISETGQKTGGRSE